METVSAMTLILFRIEHIKFITSGPGLINTSLAVYTYPETNQGRPHEEDQ